MTPSDFFNEERDPVTGLNGDPRPLLRPDFNLVLVERLRTEPQVGIRDVDAAYGMTRLAHAFGTGGGHRLDDGYDIYRFGGSEMGSPEAPSMLRRFFERERSRGSGTVLPMCPTRSEEVKSMKSPTDSGRCIRRPNKPLLPTPLRGAADRPAVGRIHRSITARGDMMSRLDRGPSENTLSTWKAAIHKLGSKRIRLRALLKCFGLVKRGVGTEQAIRQWLLDTEGGPFYTYGLDGFDKLTLETWIEISDHEITRIGSFVKKEQELMDRFESEILPKLGLRDPVRAYPPKGTRDRLDYLCEDDSGFKVVVELKKEDGEKHGVEQVMRYIGLIKAEGHKRVRGILITGYADPPTRKALHGRERDQHIDWWVYGLDGDSIRLEPINLGESQTSHPTRHGLG